ncbi:MAG: hypothetical protein ACIPMY_00375 [Rickettsia endosymbiont of Pentastiridius leporinus]
MTNNAQDLDSNIFNAENTLNYFRILYEANKLGICTRYISDLINFAKHSEKSILYEILKLAHNNQEYGLLSEMKQLVPALETYINDSNLLGNYSPEIGFYPT